MRTVEGVVTGFSYVLRLSGSVKPYTVREARVTMPALSSCTPRSSLETKPLIPFPPGGGAKAGLMFYTVGSLHSNLPKGLFSVSLKSSAGVAWSLGNRTV